jgi:hypothetical protein
MRSDCGLSGFAVSHPCARKKAQGWGTEHFRPVEEILPAAERSGGR